MEELLFPTGKKEELVDITAEVKRAVSRQSVKEGICCLFVPHGTAALFINENEPGLMEDLLNSLSYMVPNQLPASGIALAKVTGKMAGWTGYKHDQVDNNATAHIKAALVGPSLTLTIHEGNIVLGTWQQVFLAEFDGPQNKRRVMVQVVGR